MYKEKLINYIDSSPFVSFIITINETLLTVEFKKDNNLYYFDTSETKQNENGSYITIGEPEREPLDSLDEDTCKIFVEKFESMILEEYIKLNKND